MFSVVTDTTAGLSRTEAAGLGCDVMPMTYVTDGERHVEGMLGENEGYPELFAKSKVVTSEAVRASSFAATFREHLAAGRDVLCVTISSRLSGTYRSACEAAEALDGLGRKARAAAAGAGSASVPDAIASHVGRAAHEAEVPRVSVFDSWSTAAGLEFIVRRACGLARAGASLDEALADLETFRAGQRIAFTVPDINVLRRSGRLGAVRASLATKLSRYPLMQLAEGAIREVGSARGAASMGRELAAMAPEGTSEFVISHFGEPGVEARQLLVAVRRRFPKAAVRVKDGGPVLAKNLGLGAVSLAWSQA